MSKQYLFLCDENGLKHLDGLIRGVQFIEVTGLSLNDRKDVMVLATPNKPVEQIDVKPDVKPEA